MTDALDVVVVPDFAGTAQRLFEARTLLFLGSWLEHTGASRSWPLHLACIGEPPAAVQELASRCGAIVSLHADLEIGGRRFLNKLRGLEVEARTDRILLLDADTVVLGDLAPALELGQAFAALPAATNRIAPGLWDELYAAADAKPPRERMRPLIAELEDELPPGVMREQFRAEVPLHWNSGVLLVPARCGLRREWERAARILEDKFARREGFDHVLRNDQPSLAVAAARVREEEGVSWRELPPRLHGLDLFFAAGRLTFEETRLYHAKTFFRRDKSGPFDPLREVDLYRAHQVPRLYPETRAARLLRRVRGERHAPRAHSILALCDRLEALTRQYVIGGPA